jgi:DNA-binding transcriptional LysR family regulator
MKYSDILNISFQQIQIFLKSVELRNYTKVAEYFNFTPSMISKTIALIETEIGLQLFVRGFHELSPTPAAQVLAFEWESILKLVENSIDKAQSCQKGIKTLINIGFIDSSSKVDNTIMQLINDYYGLNPDVDIRVEKFDMHELVERLRKGLLDIIITALHESPSLDAYRIPWNLLFETNMAIYASKTSKLFEKDDIEYGDLKDESFLVLSPAQNAHYYAFFDLFCKKNGITPQIAMSFTNVRSMQYNLKLGKGIFIGDSLTSDWIDDDIKQFVLPDKIGTIIGWRDNINEKIDDLVSFFIENMQYR